MDPASEACIEQAHEGERRCDGVCRSAAALGSKCWAPCALSAHGGACLCVKHGGGCCVDCDCLAVRHAVDDEERRQCMDCDCAQFVARPMRPGRDAGDVQP
jgi:hypothetical protein